MWQGVVVVCAPIQPCAVQFSCLSFSLLLPFAAATSSNGRWEVGAWHDVHVVVCLHAMFSVWRGLLLRTHRSRRLDTLPGVGGDRQMQVEKFLGIFFLATQRFGKTSIEAALVGAGRGLAAPSSSLSTSPIKRHRQSLA